MPHRDRSNSVFFALFEDEKGANTVQELLELASKHEIAVFVSFATFAEVFYITFREQGVKEAHKRIELMTRLAIKRVEFVGRVEAPKPDIATEEGLSPDYMALQDSLNLSYLYICFL